MPTRFSLNNHSIVFTSPFINKQSVGSSPLSLLENILDQLFFPQTGNQPQTPLAQLQCHGGIPVYFQHTVNCLCPPHLYGSKCEYQRQRVSVTLQIGAPEWQTPFNLVIYLLDDKDEIVNSYYQIRYLSIRDCNTKFNFHLLYSSLPKSTTTTYSIRIHVFEM
ncbi:unnamed protein product, partial [Adineta ricciae]